MDQITLKLNICEQLIEVLSSLEPGISNSMANVKFELSSVKIEQIKRQNNLTAVEIEKLMADEVKNTQDAFDILMAGSESKNQLESRLKRVIAQSAMKLGEF